MLALIAIIVEAAAEDRHCWRWVLLEVRVGTAKGGVLKVLKVLAVPGWQGLAAKGAELRHWKC